MRTILWVTLASAAAMTLLGCSDSAPSAPASASASAPALADAGANPPAEFVAGLFNLHVEPGAASGTITPLAREGAVAGQLFYLNVSQFEVVPRLMTLELDGNNNVLATVDVAHPFPAPANLTAPPNGFSNRADLGISGRIVVLAGIDTTTLSTNAGNANYIGNSQFTISGNQINLNSGAVLNAAAYVDPGDMIPAAAQPAGNATHFPALQLVEESGTGSRTGISNGGVSTGNYNAGAGGWQDGNIGAGNNGWTGFGFLAQGQTSRRQIVFGNDAATSGIDFTFAVIANYTDPRQGATPPALRANRLPVGNDASRFCYFMPAGAVDLENLAPQPAGTLATTAGSTLALPVNIIDFDNAATVVGTFPDLANLNGIPAASGVASLVASSTELGMSDVAGAESGGSGSGTYESPAIWDLTVTNESGSDGGADGGARVGILVDDDQDGTEHALYLDNSNPPGPLPGTPPNYLQVVQVVFIDIA